MSGEPGDHAGNFLFRHGGAGSVVSPVWHASVGAAGDHRCADGLVAHKSKERRIDNRSADPVFAVAVRAIALEDGLAERGVAQFGAVCRKSNSSEILRP